MLAIFIVVERKSLITNSSLFIANMTHDMGQYSGDPAWIRNYNEAIWLSASGQYIEAKAVLAPLLNDIHIEKKAEIAELYGDLIYFSSGSLDDTIQMYDRSLSFVPSPRITQKIQYIKQIKNSKTGFGNTEISNLETPKTGSGASVREAKKMELKQIAGEREKYLGNNISSQSSIKSDLQQLIQSVESGSLTITQDW